MVYTVTLNPALDYILKTKKFEIGKENRSTEEITLPGGKGINVSLILKELEIESNTIGFIAGYVGEKIEQLINEKGIETDFVKIPKEVSRINVKITNKEDETAINCKGPYIEKIYIEKLYEKLQKINKNDTLVLSGSIPQGISNDIYKEICKRIKNTQAKVVVDATGDLLINTLEYHPFLIKPNINELQDIFKTKISNKDEALEYAEKLQEKGAKNVLVSMGGDGSVLLDENGYSYKMNPITNGERINTVGAGDSMVAGFIAGYEKYHSCEKALQLGAACRNSNGKFYIFGNTKRN